VAKEGQLHTHLIMSSLYPSFNGKVIDVHSNVLHIRLKFFCQEASLR
jgi:hypothetical protein